MLVLDELKKSVKALDAAVKELDKIQTIPEFDIYEMKVQKIVFELQMKANQVAGEFVPSIRNKRIELQNANASIVMDRVRKAQELAKARLESEQKENNGDDNRQPEPDTGDSKPKSAKKAK